jgi:serine/threonine protein kinase
MANPRPPLEKLGKYELVGRIGFGGMAEVYLARQKGPAGFVKLVAIKRLLPHLHADKGLVEMFLDEARIAARISHPNVVQIFDLGQVDDTYFIAMEYLDGESLAKVLGQSIRRERPMPLDLVPGVVAQFCRGLDYAHGLQTSDGNALQIVHRDVSPQNIAILYNGTVKILDFGIAKARERLTETTHGSVKGKFAYMAPEQCLGEALDHRTDLFASGIVLWECLTRRRLFKHVNKLRVIQLVTECRIHPPSKLNPLVPAELDRITLKALAKDPDDRYQTGAAFANDLEDYITKNGLNARAPAISKYLCEEFKEERNARASLIRKARTNEVPQFKPTETAEFWLGQVPEITGTAAGSERATPSLGQLTPIEFVNAPAPPAPGPSRLLKVAALLSPVAIGIVFALFYWGADPGAKIRVQSAPKGATIHVDGKLQKGKTPTVVGPFSKGKHSLMLRHTGFRDWRRQLDLVAGETLRIEATLKTETPTQKVDGTTEPTSRRDAGLTIPADGATAAASPDATKTPPSKRTPTQAPPRRYGSLNLNTRPWATISYRGRRIGNTPLLGVRLPAGVVRLKAVNKDLGIRKTITVRIVAGKLSRKVIQLR